MAITLWTKKSTQGTQNTRFVRISNDQNLREQSLVTEEGFALTSWKCGSDADMNLETSYSTTKVLNVQIYQQIRDLCANFDHENIQRTASVGRRFKKHAGDFTKDQTDIVWDLSGRANPLVLCLYIENKLILYEYTIM